MVLGRLGGRVFWSLKNRYRIANYHGQSAIVPQEQAAPLPQFSWNPKCFIFDLTKWFQLVYKSIISWVLLVYFLKKISKKNDAFKFRRNLLSGRESCYKAKLTSNVPDKRHRSLVWLECSSGLEFSKSAEKLLHAFYSVIYCLHCGIFFSYKSMCTWFAPRKRKTQNPHLSLLLCVITWETSRQMSYK